METIKIKGSRFSVSRESDGAGDSGPMLVPFDRVTWKEIGENGTIEIGKSIRCGSVHARTMQAQDYWTTTDVCEVLERADDDSWVKVKTANSVYTIRGF